MGYGTIREFIESGSNDIINYHNLSLIDSIDGIDCPYDNVVYDYLDELMQLSENIKLSSKEYIKYKYRPDLLSYDLYGTDKYEFIILAINNIESDKLFDTDTLRLISVENMNEVMNYIYNSQFDYINYNRNKEDSNLIDDKKYEL